MRVLRQMLLFPDPRPLIDQLGADFFRQAPAVPGVYLMSDREQVLYVGKAKNLRKRLGSYRVANPDRLPRRHLRLLRAVVRIDVQECADEASALARESELLRQLRPRYNRAGTWPGRPRLLLWRISSGRVELCISEAPEPGWRSGGLAGGAEIVRACLARLLWCGTRPGDGLTALPHSWFRGRHTSVTALPCSSMSPADLAELEHCLETLFQGDAEPLKAWVNTRAGIDTHPFELAVRQGDLETATEFARRQRQPRRSSPTNTAAVPSLPVRQRQEQEPDLFSQL